MSLAQWQQATWAGSDWVRILFELDKSSINNSNVVQEFGRRVSIQKIFNCVPQIGFHRKVDIFVMSFEKLLTCSPG